MPNPIVTIMWFVCLLIGAAAAMILGVVLMSADLIILSGGISVLGIIYMIIRIIQSLKGGDHG